MRRSILVVLLAIVLVLPVGAAWNSGRSSWEPDTVEDKTGGYMWATPDTTRSTTAGWSVYFNGITYSSAEATSYNPNVAELHSRFYANGGMLAQAVLGVWKDCNRDGYMGAAAGAVLQYRNELLQGDHSVCPVQSGTSPLKFNDGIWVYEFFPIGPFPMGNSANRTPESLRSDMPVRGINDTEARVWADFGRPGGANEVHFDCAQLPFPRGTFDSTGGLLVYVDCQFGYNVAKAINSADGELDLGIGFADPYHPERDCSSPFNVDIPTYGRDGCGTGSEFLQKDSGDPAFTVFDCSSPRENVVHDPTGAPGQRGQLSSVGSPPLGSGVNLADPNGNYVSAPAISPSVGNVASGSYVDAIDNAYDGPATHTTNNQNVQYRESCDHTTYSANNTDQESTFAGTNPTDGKRLTDWAFSYSTSGHRRMGSGDSVPPIVRIATGQDTPEDFGRGNSPATWSGNVEYIPPPYLGGTVRNSDLKPVSAMYFTFYATMSAANIVKHSLKFPSQGKFGTYGSEACGTATTGVRNQWDCDKTHWWNPDLGGSADGTWINARARPGWTYIMRDVDCVDGDASDGSGVFVGPAYVSDDDDCPTV